MKKVKIIIEHFNFRSNNYYYADIQFDSMKLDNPDLVTENYKTAIGALKAAKKICKDFGLDYEVVI